MAEGFLRFGKFCNVEEATLALFRFLDFQIIVLFAYGGGHGWLVGVGLGQLVGVSSSGTYKAPGGRQL